MLYGAVVVYVVVVVGKLMKGEPVVPARGLGGATVTVLVLAEEPSRVTGELQTRGDVVTFIAVPLVTCPATVADVGVGVEDVFSELYLGVVSVTDRA